MSQRKARPALAAWLVCFAFAAALLLLCTGTSPLYNGHDWTDGQGPASGIGALPGPV